MHELEQVKLFKIKETQPEAKCYTEESSRKVVQYLSDGLDGCSMFKEELHHFHSVLLTGNVKWSETILHTGRKNKNCQ